MINYIRFESASPRHCKSPSMTTPVLNLCPYTPKPCPLRRMLHIPNSNRIQIPRKQWKTLRKHQCGRKTETVHGWFRENAGGNDWLEIVQHIVQVPSLTQHTRSATTLPETPTMTPKSSYLLNSENSNPHNSFIHPRGLKDVLLNKPWVHTYFNWFSTEKCLCLLFHRPQTIHVINITCFQTIFRIKL